MSITIKNGARIFSTQTPTGYAGARVTYSVFFRLSNHTPVMALKIGSGISFAARDIDATSSQYTGVFNISFAGGSPTTTSLSIPGMSVGSTYHFLLVYDKDDPARQFLSVNGARRAITSGGMAISNLSAVWEYSSGDASGPTGDVTFSHSVVVDGYAATDEDVAPLLAGPSTTPDFVSAMLAKPGARVVHHSFEGIPGNMVVNGDPGIIWGSDQQDWFKFKTGGTYPPLFYSDPMPYNPNLRVAKAYVGSTGRTITVSLCPADSVGKVQPLVPDLASPPSIRINGGTPIVLGTTTATGAYIQTDAEAMLFALPPGTVVTPGQSVTVSASAGWFRGGVGYAPEMIDEPVDNYAGSPISKGLWPNGKPIRGGLNMGRSAATTITATPVVKNRALCFGRTEDAFWPDGTLKGDYNFRAFASSGRQNSLDDIGIPGVSGLWVVRWDDFDHANPVTIELDSAEIIAEERVDLRNFGDSVGRGKARVYDFQVGFGGRCKLSAGVDAAATTIPFTKLTLLSALTKYLVIGDEWIRIGSIDSAAGVFRGCVRGWLGTTASPHAKDAVGVARLFSSGYGVRIKISSPDPANTHYANLAVYDPEGWDGPTGPGPVSIPAPTVDDNLESHRHISSIMATGLGCARHIQTIPAQSGDWDEVDQFTPVDSPHISGRRVVDKFHVASIAAFDPVASPYFYSSTPYPNTETYAATLGSPLASAVPGTIETITITDGRNAPILVGQILFAGDEKLRVVSIPLVGDQYQVERGAHGSPTGSRSAGPITVGYRVPVTKSSQYNVSNSNYLHYYEATFDESNSSPLRFGRTLGAVDATVIDANLSASRTFALTAPLSADSTDVYATPADPGDWDVVAKYLSLKIGSEILTVDSVDPTAGKITVNPRTEGSGSYPIGETVTTASSRVLFQIPDGTKKAYQPLFHGLRCMMFPTGVGKALIVTEDVDRRTKSVLGANATPVFAQSFDPLKASTPETPFPTSRTSYAFVARQTAASPGCWLWMNVPLRATDAAVYEAARQVRDNFPAGRKVIFELSNEIWNEGTSESFAQSYRSQVMSSACGNDNKRSVFILRSKSAFDVVKACFAETGRGDEVLLAICWQTGNEILSTCRELGVEPDVYAVAPYLYQSGNDVAYGAMFNALDREQMCDFFTFTLIHRVNGSIRSVGARMRASIAAHEAITGKRPLAATYEGGLETVVNPNIPGLVDPQRRKSRDVISSPGFYFVEFDSYAAMREFMGVELFNQYAITDERMVSAGKGPTTFWGMLTGPAQKIGRGDGRDGGTNNLLYSFENPTDDPRRGPDLNWESVRMQALLDWNKEWREANGGGDPDPIDPKPVDPGDRVISKAKRLPIPSKPRYRFG